MNLPKNTARVMRDLANVIEEALIPSGYGDFVIDEVDAKKALRKYEQWRKAAAKPKP